MIREHQRLPGNIIRGMKQRFAETCSCWCTSKHRNRKTTQSDQGDPDKDVEEPLNNQNLRHSVSAPEVPEVEHLKKEIDLETKNLENMKEDFDDKTKNISNPNEDLSNPTSPTSNPTCLLRKTSRDLEDSQISKSSVSSSESSEKSDEILQKDIEISPV